MQKELSASVHPSAVVGTTLMVSILCVVGLVVFSGSEAWGALVLAPLLVAVTLPALARQANREAAPMLFWLLTAALILKLLGALARYYVAFDLYEGGADATGYHEWGVELSQKFRAGDFATGLETPLAGTDFIRLLTGIVYTIIGTTTLGGFVVYSWLGFLGLFLFYRAFQLSVPEGRSQTYAKLMFFLPSLLFWPSSIGKEAWMMIALGIAAFGAARLLTGRAIRGVAVMSLGLWLAALIRPHIAGLLAIGVVVGFLIRRRPREGTSAGPLARAVVLAGLAAVSLVMVARAEQFLQDAGLDTGGGVSSTLSQTTERTGKGGSRFAPSILGSPATAPLAVTTVLYRPFVFEAGSGQAALAALEGTVLLIITLVRLPWVLAAVKSIRRQPYVGFALVYSGLLVLALSGFANFGILARQRVQLLPLFLVLLAIPPLRRAREAGRDA